MMPFFVFDLQNALSLGRVRHGVPMTAVSISRRQLSRVGYFEKSNQFGLIPNFRHELMARSYRRSRQSLSPARRTISSAKSALAALPRLLPRATMDDR